MNQDYRAVYKNTGTTPRTLDQAFKTADYATPIWRCETGMGQGFRFLVDALIGLAYVLVPMLTIYLILTWLG